MPCTDPEILMRGGSTKMVIFGHRRGGGGVQPPKNPKITFFQRVPKCSVSLDRVLILNYNENLTFFVEYTHVTN